PKNISFLVDSSGSMAGEPMRQAKQALLNGLQFLAPQDKFNIIDFDSTYRSLFPRPQFASQANLRLATNLVQGLDADGGTEMAGALSFTLNQAGSSADGLSDHANNYLNQVVFITDGAVGNERQLFELISKRLRDTRLFTIGIGSAPNEHFMRKAAEFGRGTTTMIGEASQVSEKVTALFSLLSTPVLRDLSASWPTGVEVYPSVLPDLYQNTPLVVLVKSSKPLRDIDLTGTLSDRPWQSTIARTESRESTSQRLSVLWARKKVAHLMNETVFDPDKRSEHEAQILELGLKHKLLTKFTSFVAVEKEPSRPLNANASHEKVPNLMPHGSTMQIPQTATFAELGLWLSLLCSLLALVGIRQARRDT
ncbi:MAG: VWA domain-containing protein, partial [Pseudomonadota bacterium]